MRTISYTDNRGPNTKPQFLPSLTHPSRPISFTAVRPCSVSGFAEGEGTDAEMQPYRIPLF